MRLLVLSDIHIGSIKDVMYVYNVITEIFDNELILNKCDAVIILGDYFHKVMRLNEEYTSLAINIMSYLVRTCKKSKTKIRLLYGTESHESQQYRIFNYFMTDPDIDFKVIDTVCIEKLFPNVRVLYVPEEYVDSKEKYYHDYLYSDNQYDYIFLHGVIVEGMPQISYDPSPKSNEKKVPHFKSKELSSISRICIAGHEHSFKDMGDDCYYLGSLFRDSFGEEEPKGYGIIEDGKFTFVENKKAYVYKTYTYDDSSDVYQSADNILREINKIKEENSDIFDGRLSGKIRVIFKTPKDIDSTFKENVRTLLFNDKYISSMIKEPSEIMSELQETIDEGFDFVLDNSLSITDKIHMYITRQYNSNISLDELTGYINEEFKMDKYEI